MDIVAFENLFGVTTKEIHEMIVEQRKNGEEPARLILPEIRLFGLPILLSGSKILIENKVQKMSKFKMCESVGLEVYHVGHFGVAPSIKASEVEAMLSKGVRVYNDIEREDEFWTNSKYYKNKQTGLVIDIKPIERVKPVSKSEILEVIEGGHSCTLAYEALVDTLERILEAGVSDEG